MWFESLLPYKGSRVGINFANEQIWRRGESKSLDNQGVYISRPSSHICKISILFRIQYCGCYVISRFPRLMSATSFTEASLDNKIYAEERGEDKPVKI